MRGCLRGSNKKSLPQRGPAGFSEKIILKKGAGFKVTSTVSGMVCWYIIVLLCMILVGAAVRSVMVFRYSYGGQLL
jgi:hypothetical protein